MLTQLTHEIATLSRRRWLAAGAALVLGLATFTQAKAQDQIGFRHQIYREDDDRIEVITNPSAKYAIGISICFNTLPVSNSTWRSDDAPFKPVLS